jgi:hypothetical protein
MYACVFDTFPMAKKRKEKKQAKDLYIQILWAILLRKISAIPTYIEKMLFQV